MRLMAGYERMIEPLSGSLYESLPGDRRTYRMSTGRHWFYSLLIGVLLCPAGLFASGLLAPGNHQQTSENKQMGPQMPEAHFHHLHLNTIDPKAAIDFYPAKFDCEKAKFAGSMDAVWTQKSWILFNKVDKPPISDFTSAIWHFGWLFFMMKSVIFRFVRLL